MDQTGLRRQVDLLAVAAGAVLSLAAVLLLAAGNPLRVVLGLSLALLLPGYGVLSALLPGRSDPDNGNLGSVDRLALAFATSIAVTILVGIGLSVSPVGLSLGPLVAILAGLTLLTGAVGAWRRTRLPAESQFRVETAGWRERVRAQTVDAAPLDRALTLAVVVAALVLVASLLFTGPLTGAIASATGGEAPSDPAFTEAFLLNTSGGEPIADEYPTELGRLETAELTVGLTNREGQQVRYTVVVLTQAVENGTVVDQQELHRFTPTLPANTRWQRDHLVRPTFEGQVRFQYLVYRGDPPATPSIDSAYRELHVFVETT